MAYKKDLLERALGNIGTAGDGLCLLYKIAEEQDLSVLESYDWVSFLLGIVRNLEKTVEALVDIREDRLERAKESLDEVRW